MDAVTATRPGPIPTSARWAIAALVGGALAGVVAKLFYSVVVVYGVATELRACAAWGLLLLLSFTGWGSALNSVIEPRARADWGLRCAWGWGVVVAIGGVLCALEWAKGFVLVRLVAIGLCLCVADVIHELVRWARRGVSWRGRLACADWRFHAASVPIYLLALIQAGGAIQQNEFNANDDNIAYFQFAREIVERGTLSQPFSLRHISAFGGKSFLDALAVSIDVRETHLHMVDKSLGILTVLGLLAGQARVSRRTSRPVLLLLMGFLVALPNGAINTTTMFVGVVFFLGIYRTLKWPPLASRQGLRSSLPVAILAAGACTLRQNYLPVVAVTMIIAYGAPIFASLRLRPFAVSRDALRETVQTALVLLACLAPWCALSYRWCGTALFPIRMGNYDPAYSFFPQMNGSEWAHYIWQNVAYCLPIKALPFFVLAATMMPDENPRRPFRAIVLAAILGFAALLYGYSHGTTVDQSRYYFGFTVAAIFAIGLAASEHASARVAPGRDTTNRAISVGLVVLGMSLQLYDERGTTTTTYNTMLDLIANNRVAWAPSSRNRGYALVQQSIPAGAPIAVMVDDPYRFDQARNRIAVLDMIGGVSPPPGIPLAKGGDAVADYLQGLGYRYLVFINPANARSLYRRDIWQRQEKKSAKVWEQSAHYYLEAFDDFEQLAGSRAHLTDADGMNVLDLATRK